MSDIPQIPPRPSEQGQPGLHIVLEGFELSAEVEAVAERLTAKHGRFRWLGQFRVAYLLEHADLPAGGKYCDWAKARLVPKWARALTSYDAAITVNALVWGVLRERHREALVLHELLHLGQNEKTGRLEMVPHDVEEFSFVVAEHGAWRPSLQEFMEQLSLGMGDGG
jgi:hypothetical protein